MDRCSLLRTLNSRPSVQNLFRFQQRLKIFPPLSNLPFLSKMGGEWIFSFNNKDLSKFDLKAYQKMLVEIKQQYEKKFAEEEEAAAENYGNVSYFWCGDDVPPADNIFARFGYECSRHSWHGSGESGHGQAHAHAWCLFWDPTVLTGSDLYSHVHARCAPHWFKMISNKIQTMLEKAFPHNFELYWGDGISGVGAEFDYGYQNDYSDEDEPDYEYCDLGCGYCGKCSKVAYY